MEAFSSSSSLNSQTRFKVFGAAVAVVVLVVVGVVALNDSPRDVLVPLERAQAIAHAENANVAISQLPDESEMIVPKGWRIESDAPVDGAGSESEEEDAEPLVEQVEPEDDDMDSQLMFEYDEEGNKYVADALDKNVVIDKEKNENENELDVAEDRRCGKYRKLRKCAKRKKCTTKCVKKCDPRAIRRCKHKKFCRCFCKYKGNMKLARRCVIYKRKTCKVYKVQVCKKNCRKFCKLVPHCYYCCAKRRVGRFCKRMCKRIRRKTVCANCSCWRKKCYRFCRYTC